MCIYMYIYISILYICGTIYGVFNIGGMGLQKDSVANCWLLAYLFPLLVIFIIIPLSMKQWRVWWWKSTSYPLPKKPLNYFIIYCVYVKYMYVYIYTHMCGHDPTCNVFLICAIN